MNLLNPSMRTQETIHCRGFPDMDRYAAKLDINEERQNATTGTRQTTPSLA
jgi:anti-sigma regulatory factor (Ser/Thr protein kinase)